MGSGTKKTASTMTTSGERVSMTSLLLVYVCVEGRVIAGS